MKKSFLVGNMLRSVYLDYIQKFHNGLVTVPLPTSIGKTYSACAAIAQQVAEWKNKSDVKEKDKRKIVFVTTLKKNLPQAELRKAFDRLNLDYDKEVMVLKSNLDSLMEAYLNNLLDTVPLEYQTPAYHNLCFDCKVLSSGDSQNKEGFLQNFKENEPVFRRQLRSLLLVQKLKTGTSINDLLLTNDFKWIADIYPAALWQNYSVFLMTMRKLVSSKVTLTDNVKYLSKEWLGNAVVFIDEYDATKMDVADSLISQPARIDDYYRLFADIYDKLKGIKDCCSDSMRQAYQQVDKSKRHCLADVIKRADDIYSHYGFPLSYKASGSDKERNSFLYHCRSWITAMQDSARHELWAKMDKKENRVNLFYGNMEECKDEQDIFLVRDLLSAVDHFLHAFTVYLGLWAKAYMEIENDKKKNADDKLSLDEAANSLLFKFFAENDPRRSLFIDDIQFNDDSCRHQHYISSPSFFTRGFLWYSLSNSRLRNEDTCISCVGIPYSPESVMLYLARHALVFGISATANCDSVIGNYCISFLKAELGNDYHDLLTECPDLVSAVKSELAYRYAPYAEGKKRKASVTLRPLTNCYNGPGDDVRYVMNRIIDGDCAGDLGELVDSEGGNVYFKSRYINIAKVMYEFAGRTHHQSLLCLTTAIPGGNANADFKEETLHLMLDIINDYYHFVGTDSAVDLLVLRSADFENSRNLFDTKLAEGKRLFVLSSYYTIGTGINLQYAVNNLFSNSYITLPSHSPMDTTKKDIDEVALFDITNTVVNLCAEGAFSENSQLTNIMQTESAYADYRLSLDEKIGQIRLGFIKLACSFRGKGNVLDNTEVANMNITHLVIQACGRIGRTLNRCKDSYVYIDEKVFSRLCIPYLQSMSDFLPPEMLAICHEAEARCKPGKVEADVAQYNAKRLSLMGNAINYEAHKWLKGILKRGFNINDGFIAWEPSDMKLWQNIRDFVLKHPTATLDGMNELEDIRPYYMHVPVPCRHYFFSQKDDFSHVRVGFDCMESLRQEIRNDESWKPVSEVSASAVQLDILLKNPSVAELFSQQGYAADFDLAPYILPPVLFNNIYKGALGEVCGKALLESGGVSLSAITDADKFEAFDFCLDGCDDAYVDFKYYQFHYGISDEEKKRIEEAEMQKIERKMLLIGATRVFIVGIIKPDADVAPYVVHNGAGSVVFVPFLIDGNGRTDADNFLFLINHIKNDK